MPYIQQGIRSGLKVEIDNLVRAILARANISNAPGIVNFAIIETLMKVYKPQSYCEWNEILGILEAVKHEVYRRGIAPYEDQKIRENGDLEVFRQVVYRGMAARKEGLSRKTTPPETPGCPDEHSSEPNE